MAATASPEMAGARNSAWSSGEPKRASAGVAMSVCTPMAMGTAPVRQAPRLLDERMVRRQPARRIGDRGIAGERIGLAAAAAEIDAAPIAALAGLRHPVLAAKRDESRRAVPDGGERGRAHVVELEGQAA